MAFTAEQAHEYQLKRYVEVMARAVAYLGGVCVKCGSTDRLEIDHVDRATKSFEISSATCYAWHRVEAELAKCQLLCYEHHKEKSVAEKRTIHGGGTQGIRACKCELCLVVRRQYQAKMKRQRREREALAELEVSTTSE